jgi:hypothetical protein
LCLVAAAGRLAKRSIQTGNDPVNSVREYTVFLRIIKAPAAQLTAALSVLSVRQDKSELSVHMKGDEFVN